MVCTVIIKLKVTYNLSHGLREIVYDQVGFSVVFYQIWTCHAVLHHLNITGLTYISRPGKYLEAEMERKYLQRRETIFFIKYNHYIIYEIGQLVTACIVFLYF